jgi:rhamnosyltransferase
LRDKAVSSEDINWDKVLMHDAWVMEIGAVFGKVRCIDEPLVYYRQTGFNEMGAVTESEADKISRNIDTASKGFFEAKKAFINEARDFAREINKLSDIPMEKRKILKEFVNIGSKPKLFRMRFYKVNNFTRAHHSFWMRLWV